MRKRSARARFVKKTIHPQSTRNTARDPKPQSTHSVSKSLAMFQLSEDAEFPALVPRHFLKPSPLEDELTTQSSEVQQETVAECLPLLGIAGDPSRDPFEFNEFGVPELRKEDHIAFLQQNLSQFPAPFVGLDASRPWLVYWGLLGLYFLGEDITVYRKR
jgi:protein farnesyltransferase subunit beta